jgi:3-phenylpropionate/trans-cinnamate dioxygenase ferredoxin reductase subunit
VTEYAQTGIVIVGGGQAGGVAAESLRSSGYAGLITMIGAESELPYERPPLSKRVLTDTVEPVPPWILWAEKLEELKITHQAQREAIRIDRIGQVITLRDGARIAYTKLLLATGSTPRRLPLSAVDPAIMYLRTFSDALALRRRLTPGRQIVIIGGGLIGLEVAAAAASRGADVTVVESASRLLARGVPKEIADIVAKRHERANVRLSIGVNVSHVARLGEKLALTLSDGSRITAETVIVGVGSIPETALASEAGLRIENGVAVDQYLRTSDPNIFAAGDCCSIAHPLFGGSRVRLEAWRNAQEQGALAAKNMLGAELPFRHVPWFWSDQYELCLQVAGLPQLGEQIIERDAGPDARLLFHLTSMGTLVAVTGIGPPGSWQKDLRVGELLIAAGAPLSPDALSSPATRLKSLLRA